MTLSGLAARTVVAGGDFFMPPLRRRARQQVTVLVHGAALCQRIGPGSVLAPARSTLSGHARPDHRSLKAPQMPPRQRGVVAPTGQGGNEPAVCTGSLRQRVVPRTVDPARAADADGQQGPTGTIFHSRLCRERSARRRKKHEESNLCRTYRSVHFAGNGHACSRRERLHVPLPSLSGRWIKAICRPLAAAGKPMECIRQFFDIEGGSWPDGRRQVHWRGAA